jgi:DNA-binding SARP family transcriptional activator
MELLADSGLEADTVLGLYDYFYPPIGLGKGFNSDLNLAYKQDLAMEKPQGYLNILYAHCCMEMAKAFQALGRFADAVTEQKKLPLNRFASLDSHQALISNLFEVHDRDGVLQVAMEWFAQQPLDTGIWNPIYNVYARLGDKAVTIRFLEEVETLAEAFLSADQIGMIRDLLLKERTENESGS